MDVLIQEIAKTFNIGNETVQNIINNYPQLRQQIALYNVTTTVQPFALAALFISVVVFLFASAFYIKAKFDSIDESRYYTKDELKLTSELTRKVAKASLVVIITSVIVFIAMTVINSVYAPDVIMLKSIMSSMK